MRQVTDGSKDTSIFTLKELSESIPESPKSKMLTANPKLERVWQFVKVQKRVSLHILSYTTESMQALFKLLLIIFFFDFCFF